ncbi:hypothetical protein C8244_14860 [Paracidovorax avenae]|uniref:hypothetical protein n=1 Tax=Paracidovorax avenae TaxID=80867 RepID=UPI000D1799A7|nr:hypothetical protein [Paracidovorax avenae]AVT17357.1 hypothetical protein C8244_14860 [Paracidovorax avenae]
MNSLIQILKVNEPRSGISDKTKKPWTMQEAEVALLDDNGEIQKVGGLMLPREMVGDKAPEKGVYIGSFALDVNYMTRRVEAVLVDLRPYSTGRSGAAPAPAATPAAPAASKG